MILRRPDGTTAIAHPAWIDDVPAVRHRAPWRDTDLAEAVAAWAG